MTGKPCQCSLGCRIKCFKFLRYAFKYLSPCEVSVIVLFFVIYACPIDSTKCPLRHHLVYSLFAVIVSSFADGYFCINFFIQVFLFLAKKLSDSIQRISTNLKSGGDNCHKKGPLTTSVLNSRIWRNLEGNVEAKK